MDFPHNKITEIPFTVRIDQTFQKLIPFLQFRYRKGDAGGMPAPAISAIR